MATELGKWIMKSATKLFYFIFFCFELFFFSACIPRVGKYIAKCAIKTSQDKLEVLQTDKNWVRFNIFRMGSSHWIFLSFQFLVQNYKNLFANRNNYGQDLSKFKSNYTTFDLRRLDIKPIKLFKQIKELYTLNISRVVWNKFDQYLNQNILLAKFQICFIARR